MDAHRHITGEILQALDSRHFQTHCTTHAWVCLFVCTYIHIYRCVHRVTRRGRSTWVSHCPPSLGIHASPVSLQCLPSPTETLHPHHAPPVVGSVCLYASRCVYIHICIYVGMCGVCLGRLMRGHHHESQCVTDGHWSSAYAKRTVPPCVLCAVVCVCVREWYMYVCVLYVCIYVNE